MVLLKSAANDERSPSFQATECCRKKEWIIQCCWPLPREERGHHQRTSHAHICCQNIYLWSRVRNSVKAVGSVSWDGCANSWGSSARLQLHHICVSLHELSHSCVLCGSCHQKPCVHFPFPRYGQTGTGKTFTMEGEIASDPTTCWDKDPNIGIIPRSMGHLFHRLNSMVKAYSNVVLIFWISLTRLFMISHTAGLRVFCENFFLGDLQWRADRSSWGRVCR